MASQGYFVFYPNYRASTGYGLEFAAAGYGDAADPRVHPSQSIELFYRLKMNDHPVVRLVQYPGERHGNSKQPGRADVLYRQIDWFNWYVKDGKPFEGPMPPLDISDKSLK